jgi:peptidoglycan biosynthesis protein MviN/MurJ (putative lipid II flippase)
MRDRGRITIPDIIIAVGVLAILGILYPVFATGLENNLTEMSTPTVWMFRLMLPMALLVILSRVFRKAIVGGGQR